MHSFKKYKNDIYRYAEICEYYNLLFNRQPSDTEISKLFECGSSLSEIFSELCLSHEFAQQNNLKDFSGFYQWPKMKYFTNSEHNLRYIPIAKNACTSLKTVFFKLNINQTADEFKNINCEEPGFHQIIDTYRTMNIIRNYTPHDNIQQETKSPLHIVAVRDPLERVVSGFWDKFVRGIHQKHLDSTVRKKVIDYFSHTNISIKNITFNHFIDYIENNSPISFDPHWRPQTLYFKNVSNIKFFDVNKLNDLSEFLLTKTGIKTQVPLLNSSRSTGEHYQDLSNVSVSELSKLNKKPDTTSFLNERIISIIRDVYSDDFEVYSDGILKT